MQVLIVARNILNTAELETWLHEHFGSKHPSIDLWIQGPLRNWCIKNAEAFKADIDLDQVPDWLRRSIEVGDKPLNIVLDTRLLETLEPVVEYMAWLLKTRPETRLLQIGFDVAQARSVQWHEQQVRKPEPQEGSLVLTTYPDGWTWRKITGQEALTKEGNDMGHCVGNGGYWPEVLRHQLSIVSLRDYKNRPHVTIHLDHSGTHVLQIKGRGNKSIIDKYVPRVLDFLASHKWKSIHFDQAPGLAEMYKKIDLPVFYKYDHYDVVSNVRASSVDEQVFDVRDERTRAVIGIVVLIQDVTSNVPGYVYTRANCSPSTESAFYRLVRHLIHDKRMSLYIEESDSKLMSGTTWSNNGKGWCIPVDEESRILASVVTGSKDSSLYMMNDRIFAFYLADTHSIVLDETFKRVSMSQKRGMFEHIVDTAPIAAVQGQYFYTASFKPGHVDKNLTAALQKRIAGTLLSVEAVEDRDFLNSLLQILSQPNTDKIFNDRKKFMHNLVVTDHDLSSQGYRTGGRSINMIAPLLLGSLLHGDSLQAFRSWVVVKPVALNCWFETLIQPDHLSRSLLSYKLDVNVIERVLHILCNEFLRIVPTNVELDLLDLDPVTHAKVEKIMQYSKAHRQNAVRSKNLWRADKL
jgi:hypothetical protein